MKDENLIRRLQVCENIHFEEWQLEPACVHRCFVFVLLVEYVVVDDGVVLVASEGVFKVAISGKLHVQPFLKLVKDFFNAVCHYLTNG
jgi:hypothetical protein